VYWQDQQQPGQAWKASEDVSYILIKPSDLHRESLWGDEVSDDLQRRALSDLLQSPDIEVKPINYYCEDYYYYGQYYSECYNYYYEPYYYSYYYYDNEDYAGPVTFTPIPDDDDYVESSDESESSDLDSDVSSGKTSGSGSDVSSGKTSGSGSDVSTGKTSDSGSDSPSDFQPEFPDLPKGILGASLSDLQKSADVVANLVNMPWSLAVVSSDPDKLLKFLSSKIRKEAIKSNGGGADLMVSCSGVFLRINIRPCISYDKLFDICSLVCSFS